MDGVSTGNVDTLLVRYQRRDRLCCNGNSKVGAVRHWAEKITLALLATAGFAVAIADLFGGLDKINGALPKITLLILSTVTLFLLLEIDRLKLLDSVHAQLSKLDIDTIARELRREHYGGATKVHESLAEDMFIARLEAAERDATILQTWIPNLQRLEKALEDAIKRDVHVRVLLLQPTSLVVGLRTEALRLVQDPARSPDVKANVELCLSILTSIFKNTGADRERLQVRVYNSLPSIAVYRADEHYFVSSFLHGQLAIDSPQIEISGNDTAMARSVQRELDTLWRIGYDVDLNDWRRSIDIMRT